jgi:hypothetical protein
MPKDDIMEVKMETFNDTEKMADGCNRDSKIIDEFEDDENNDPRASSRPMECTTQ